MKLPSRILLLFCALVSFLIALSIVDARNQAYWSIEPFPGGVSVEELLSARPYLKIQITQLINIWSTPYVLVIFLSLFAGCVSLAKLDAFRIRIAVAFFYPALLATVSEYAIFFCIPIFVGMIVASAAFMGGRSDKNRRSTTYAAAALLLNVLAVLIALLQFDVWYDLIGD